jgi:hypothetical protein
MFAASALALVLAAPPGETHHLRWRLNEGDTFYYKTTTVIEMKAEVMGQTIDQKTETGVLIKFKVTRATRQETVVEMTFVEVTVRQEQAISGVGADKLKGLTFTVTLDDGRRVTKFEGYDTFLDAVGGDENQKKQAKQNVPEVTVRHYFEDAFLFVPRDRVAVGGKWDQTDTLPLDPLGALTVKTVGTLDDVSGDFATITLKGDAALKGPPPEIEPGVKLTKAEIKSENMTATYRFDRRAGRLLTVKSEMVLTGVMGIDQGGSTLEIKLRVKVTGRGEMTTRPPGED